MKLFKAIAATACALAIASAAQATEYRDSSKNYEMGHTLATGDNGGEGFGAWEIESHGSGDGWAGCGIWDPSANDFQGDWTGKKQAFGIIGKGEGFGINAYRPFRAPLAVGDSFSLEMGVNWDPNSDIYALKGFSILAKGGTLNLLTINHRSNPGNIAINGDDSSEILNAFGVYPMKWTFTAKDATTLTVTATPRDGSTTLYEKDWEVSTSAIDGFLLQSSGQNPFEDEEAAIAQGETAQMWADRRQTYFDNFVLDVAGDLPDLVDLGFTSGEWAVSNATQTLSYTLSRGSSADALDVVVKSSDESFVPGTTVSFAAGESEKSFTLDATLTGSGNYAKLTASATGCNPAIYEVKGPQYRMSAGTADLFVDDTVSLWINWDNNGIRDDSKLALVADPEDIISVPTGWSLPTEGDDIYVETSVTGLASGYTLLALTYDDVPMAYWGFNVTAPHFTISGDKSAKTGSSHEYKLSGVFPDDFEKATVSVTGDATLEPADGKLTVYRSDDPPATFTVNFGDTAGTVTLTVKNANNYPADPFEIVVSEPVDPSKFDDYVAYDDASLYEDGFNYESLGAGSEGFDKWSVVKSSAQFGGVLVDAGDGGFPAILSENVAFALYANGTDPDYSVLRPFADGASLQPGQKVSIEFVASDATGSRYVQFGRIWDGTLYNRFEIWNSGGAIGINIDGVESAINWENGIRRVVASIELEADGSAYDLSLSGYNEGSEFVSDIYKHVVNADVASWGDGIQGILIGAYDSGANFVFNKLAVEQVAEPVKIRSIGFSEAVWNPDVAGTPYKFAIGATTDDIGVVALSVSPDDGGLVLSVESVDLTGIDEAEFTVTVTESAIPAEGQGTKYTITATPADTSVAAASYDVTPLAPFFYISSDNWEYTTDSDQLWAALNASPSHYGTYYLSVAPETGVLSVPGDSALITVNSSEKSWFSIDIVGVGEADLFATHEGAIEPSGNYHFVINQGSDVEIPAPTPVKGENAGLAWDASILANGFVLRGTATLGESPDKDSWTDLVEGTDYVVEDGQVTVLYTSVYNYIALLKK